MRGQLDRCRLDVLLQVRPLRRAGDRRDILTSSQHPGEGELGGSDIFGGGDLADPLDQFEVLLEIAALEARAVPTPVFFRQVVERLITAGEKTAAQGAVGHESDPQLTRGTEDLVLGVSTPERILGLQRRDRLHVVRAADRCGAGLRQSQVAHLAFFDQTAHGTDGLFDRNLGVDTVLIVEVDMIDPQALKRSVAGAAYVVGFSADALETLVVTPHDPEFRRDHPVVPTIFDRSANQPLVLERTVHVGCVEEVEAQLGHLEPLPSKLPLMHSSSWPLSTTQKATATPRDAAVFHAHLDV